MSVRIHIAVIKDDDRVRELATVYTVSPDQKISEALHDAAEQMLDLLVRLASEDLLK